MFARWRKRAMDAFSQMIYQMVIPSDHFLRRVEEEVDFSFINELCAPYYKNGTSKGGRPAEEPERVFRALLIMVLYAIPTETALVREIAMHLAYRWFCKLGLLEKVFDHSLFYVVRRRLGPEVFEQILTCIFTQCIEKGLISNEWAFYDMTHIEASAQTYTPYERAVILARAVMRLLEQRPEGMGDDPSLPPPQACPALRRLVVEVAKEVAKAERSKEGNILRGVERLEEAVKGGQNPLPHRERVARELASQVEKEPSWEREGIKELMEQMKEKMPAAKGDRDARIGYMDKNTPFCGYKSGMLIEGKYGVIVAVHLEKGDAYQGHVFAESGVAERYVELVGQAPRKAALDAAFGYPDVALYLGKVWSGTEVFLEPGVEPPLQERQKRIFKVEEFELSEEGELFCPNTKLSWEERKMRVRCRRKDGTVEYEGVKCEGCELRSRCTTKERGPRVVRIDPQKERAKRKIKEKARTPAHKEAMRLRWAKVEAPFGHGKSYHRWRKAPYRSGVMNRIFNLLVAIALNVEKMVKYAPLERRKLAVAT